MRADRPTQRALRPSLSSAVMWFLSSTQRRGDRARSPDARGLGKALLACCSLGVLATAFPWTRLDAGHLFGNVVLPIAAETNVGFTCAVTCILSALLVLSEGRSRESRESVRSACLVLLGTTTVILSWRLFDGSAEFRGIETVPAPWYFVASAAVLLGLAIARARHTAKLPPAVAP